MVKKKNTVLTALLHWILLHFNGLSRTRQAGFAAPNHLTYQEIVAYQKAMKTKLSPFYIGIILAVDSIYLDAFAEAHEPAPQQTAGGKDSKTQVKKPLAPFMLPPGLSMEPPKKQVDG